MFEALDPDADPVAEQLKHELLEMILYGDANDARSLQLEIGPSEVGHPCPRRLAYRLAGTPGVNTHNDPWPAIVGTAIHAWLAETVDFWNRTHGTRWLYEQEIKFPEFDGKGHGDLYKDETVIDWKSSNKDLISKYQKTGVPQSYRSQVHLYGYGYRRQGLPVRDVALVFVPRAGFIKNMWVWREPYNEQLALASIQRLYRIAEVAVNVGVLTDPTKFGQIPAAPDDTCGMCLWFNPHLPPEQEASDKGCPGH